jgi:hypothetical protein
MDPLTVVLGLAVVGVIAGLVALLAWQRRERRP